MVYTLFMAILTEICVNTDRATVPQCFIMTLNHRLTSRTTYCSHIIRIVTLHYIYIWICDITPKKPYDCIYWFGTWLGNIDILNTFKAWPLVVTCSSVSKVTVEPISAWLLTVSSHSFSPSFESNCSVACADILWLSYALVNRLLRLSWALLVSLICLDFDTLLYFTSLLLGTGH